jgi:phage gp16-like protein
MPHKSPLARNKAQLVQVAKRSLGLADDDYRTILRRAAGVESSTELDDTGFGAVMDLFARLGFQSTSAAANFGRRDGFATAGHVATIRRLWTAYTAAQGDDASLGKWLESHWRVSALRFLTAEQAPKVIAALKAMERRRKPDSEAPGAA